MSESEVDISQTKKYKEMLGLTNFQATTGGTIMKASGTIQSDIYVSGTANIGGICTINSLLYVSGNTLFSDSVTINSNLYVSNDCIILGKASINSNLNIGGTTDLLGNLNIYGNTIIKDSVTCFSSINISGSSSFKDFIKLNNVKSLTNNLSFYGDNINIGNNDSLINITGTTYYVATNDLKVLDKYITINNDAINKNSNGGNCGIEILGTNGNGYIKTKPDGSRYEIVAPNERIKRYISVLDENNGLNISGNTILTTGATFNSSLNVFGNTILINNSTILSSLSISGNTIFNNNVSSLSNINILGNTIFNGSLSIDKSLYINGNMILEGSTTITSDINILGNTTILGDITLNSNLNISGNTILKGKTLLHKSLYISDKSIIQGITTVLSSLNISGYTSIYGESTINNNLLVSNNTLINGSTTILSDLNVSGNIELSGNMTLGSILDTSLDIRTNLIILSEIITQLPDYKNNQEASSGGLPLWGFYRTGGILKIRLDDIKPVLQLVENRIINLVYGQIYRDPGVTASDTVDGSLIPKLISIVKDNNNYLDTEISISGPTDIIGTNTLNEGQYTLTYQAIDNAGNKGFETRTLNIILDGTPPELILQGSTIISASAQNKYLDPGVRVIDTYDLNPIVRIIEIMKDSINYINNPIIISNIPTIVTPSLSLVEGEYSIKYIATDSSGNVSIPLYRILNVTPDVLISSFYVYDNYTTMIQYSYMQYTDKRVPLYFYNIDNIYYWKWGSISYQYTFPQDDPRDPITIIVDPSINGFMSAGQSWGLSSTFLNNIGFKYDMPWCFVIRGKRIRKSNGGLQLVFDTNASEWNSNSSSGRVYEGQFILYLSSNTYINAVNSNIITQYTDDSFFDSEFYMILSYDSSKTIKSEIMALDGTIKNSVVFNNYTYSNMSNPFHIFMDDDIYSYSYGILFSKIYLTYDQFKLYFEL